MQADVQLGTAGLPPGPVQHHRLPSPLPLSVLVRPPVPSGPLGEGG